MRAHPKTLARSLPDFCWYFPPIVPSLFRPNLRKSRRALHVVDRLTFGGKLSDVERAKRKDVEKWIDEQLFPERILQTLEKGGLNGSLYPPQRHLPHRM